MIRCLPMTHPSLKKTIQYALEANDLNTVAALTKENRKATFLPMRLAYDKGEEQLVGWRVSGRWDWRRRQLIKTDYEYSRETAREAYVVALGRVGGIGWSRARASGGIVSAVPPLFRRHPAYRLGF